MTINEILTRCREQFPGIKDRELETRVLLGNALGKSSAELIAHGEQILEDEQLERFRELFAARQRGTPIAYLTGTREFWSLPIAVNKHVLIPRHETELLVECVLELAGDTHEPRILELGTGSGAVALALASELGHGHITATDKFTFALKVARQNLDASGLKNIEIVETDWFSKLGGKRFNLVCSNPPYISPDDEHLTQGDVRFEPRHALVAGENGYASIRHIVANAKNFLISGGWVVIEHGYQQGAGVRQMFLDFEFISVSTHQDLTGNDRVTAGRAV